MDILRINPALMRKVKQQTRLRNIYKVVKEDKQIEVTPFVSQLGVDLNLPSDFDEREAYHKHLQEKHTTQSL